MLAWRRLSFRPIPSSGSPRIDVTGHLVSPAFVDAHQHLDKTGVLGFAPNPSGTLQGAREALARYVRTAPPDDIARRAARALGCDLSRVTTAIRRHINVDKDAGFRDLEAPAELREGWRDRMTVRLVAFMTPHPGQDFDWLAANIDAAVAIGDAVGGTPAVSEDPARCLDLLFEAAVRHGKPVDLHLDEHLNPARPLFGAALDRVERQGMQWRTVFSHCSLLSALPPTTYQRIRDRLLARDVAVIILPAANLDLQGRDAGILPPRGLTRVADLARSGVPFATAPDNIQDPFVPTGSGDMLEIARWTLLAGHLRGDELGLAHRLITAIPARLMGHGPDYGLREGARADLVITDGADTDTLVAGGADRMTVLARGRAVAGHVAPAAAAAAGTAAAPLTASGDPRRSRKRPRGPAPGHIGTGGRAFGLAGISRRGRCATVRFTCPSGPSALSRCPRSRSVRRSVPQVAAAVARSTASGTGAIAGIRRAPRPSCARPAARPRVRMRAGAFAHGDWRKPRRQAGHASGRVGHALKAVARPRKDARGEIGRLLDVGAQRGSGRARILGGHRLEDPGMVVKHPAPEKGRAQIVEVGAGLQPQALDRRHQHRRSRQAIEAEMEALVVLEQALDVALARGLPDGLVDRGQFLEMGPPGRRHRPFRRRPLDHGAAAAQIREPPERDRRHPDGPVVGLLERVLGDEPSQRLAHRHRRGAELAGQGADHERLRGREATCHLGAAQRRIDRLVHRLAVGIHLGAERADQAQFGPRAAPRPRPGRPGGPVILVGAGRFHSSALDKTDPATGARAPRAAPARRRNIARPLPPAGPARTEPSQDPPGRPRMTRASAGVATAPPRLLTMSTARATSPRLVAGTPRAR